MSTGRLLWTFLVSSAFYTAIALVIAIPVLRLALRKRRPELARKFYMWAGIIGLFCGGVRAGSERLRQQCLGTGANPSYRCIDYGAPGFVVFAFVGFAIAVWIVVASLRTYRPPVRDVGEASEAGSSAES